MRDTQLVVRMRFLEKCKIALEPSFAFPFLDFMFHGGDVGRELELLAVAEPNVVIWVAFEQLYTFCFKSRAEISKGLSKEFW